jgi:hypothetical protein
MIPRMALERSERGKIAGIGQFVDDEDLMIGYLTSADPINPAPPVTTILIYAGLSDYPRLRSVNAPSGWPS